MKKQFIIRPIQSKDTEEVLSIYAPYVQNTSITFDYELPSKAEFIDKIESIRHDYPWLVCLSDNKIVGYAYGSKHRYKTAYKWSVESTIYVAQGFHRLGVARLLYESLFKILKSQGFFNVYAGVTMPNVSSEEFHKSMGFTEIGIFKNIGYKLGKWHDVKWFQFHLAEHIENPKEPVSFDAI